jgi:putative ABC transport system permease protein
MSVALAHRPARIARRPRGFASSSPVLALGVAAIAAVGSVREAIQEGLSREGAAILGGDAEMSFTYRFASDDERAWMDRIARRCPRRRFPLHGDRRPRGRRTRADAGARRGRAYPLYGEVVLDPPMPLAEALAGADGCPAS